MATVMTTECRRIECQLSRVSTECRQLIDRLAVAPRRPSTDTRVRRHSTDYRPLLVECQPCIGRDVDRLSTEWRPTRRSSVDRVSIEVSIAGIDQHSIAGVFSTYDPTSLVFLLQFQLLEWTPPPPPPPHTHTHTPA